MIYDCIIIGAGPAGITAAIQLKRSGLNILMFEKNEIGGLLRNAYLIENYLGNHDISGKNLVSTFKNQLTKHNINIINSEVNKIIKNDIFIINEEYRAKSIILATGTKPRKLNIPGEESNRVFYEIVKLPAASGDIIIIGGGDVGFDNALNLHRKGANPIIVTRGKVSCLPLLKERAEKKGIKYFENLIPEKINGNGNDLELVCNDKSFKANDVLISIGRNSNHPNHQDNPGLFLAGDVQNSNQRQVHIATGDGMMAAMKVTEYLKKC